MVRVGINGFGRIGRAVFRLIQAKYSDYITIEAINDAYMSGEEMLYYMKHDTNGFGFVADNTHYYNRNKSEIGNFTSNGDHEEITVDGLRLLLFHCENNENYPWGDFGLDIIIDATGASNSPSYYTGHITSGARKVIVCSPLIDDDEMRAVNYLDGISDRSIFMDNDIIGMTSCSTIASAYILNALDNEYGVEFADIRVIRSYTNDQSLTDSISSSNLERCRAAAQNIIPTSTGVKNYISSVLPNLENKVRATAFRTPTLLGGVININAILRRGAGWTSSEINATLASNASIYEDYIGYSEDELVSSDVIGDMRAVTVCSLHTTINDIGSEGMAIVNITGLYDNEIGFANHICKSIINNY